MIRKVFIIAILALMFATTTVLAKRVYVEYPDKLIVENIEYSASYDDSLLFQKAYIIATNLQTKKVVWKKKIYSVLLNPIMEKDVQWVMITSVEKESISLVINNEKNQKFRLNLDTLEVKKTK